VNRPFWPWLAAAAIAWAAPSARADDAGAKPAAQPTTPPKLPAFARYKRPVDDVDKKTEGNFFSGLPLIAYDPSTGLGLGVGGFFTMDGKRTDPLFAVTPYRHRFFVQAYATTGGYQQHMISYDGVYLGNTPYRLRATIMFERNTNANYFGTGERTLRPLSFQGRTYSTFDDFSSATAKVDAGGHASPEYAAFEYDKPSASVTLERDFWGGRVRALYGVISQYAWIHTYDGTETQGVDASGNTVPAVHGPTLLGEYCARGAILGCGGGWDNALKAGVALDTRDFEPDPTSGVFVDATGEWSTKALGSSYNYLRFTVAARGYWSPFPKLTHLVVAGRVLYSMVTSGAPFYTMDTLALTEGDQNGLGGERTIRGFRQDRFVGHVAAVANLEVRWTFVHFKVLGQLFSLQVAPLFDVGRIFDNVLAGEDFASNWKWSAGGGLRIAWNRSTIIMVDGAASTEDVGIYVDFGMPF
jgi:hypothetical protein